MFGMPKFIDPQALRRRRDRLGMEQDKWAMFDPGKGDGIYEGQMQEKRGAVPRPNFRVGGAKRPR